MNKIEFKIVSDSSGSPVALNEMPLEVSSSLQVFLNSANGIALLQPHSSAIKISLAANGVCAIEAPTDEFNDIAQGLTDVVNESSINSDYVRHLREIQKKIKANGLAYDVVITRSGQQQSLFNKFKTTAVFRVRSGPKVIPTTTIVFLKGKLLAVGGKNPNIHLELSNEEIRTVFCSETEAQKTNTLLYKEIFISAWKECKPNRKPIYKLCDHYINENLFEEYKDFIELNNITQGTTRFHQIHDKIKNTISDSDLKKVKKIIRLFSNDSIENGKIKTVLISLKSFKESDDLRDVLEELASILRNKTGKQII